MNNSPPTCAIIHRTHKCSCRSKQVIPKISSKLGWDAFLGNVLSQTAQEFHLNTLGFLNVDALKTENAISASGSTSHCLNASISWPLTCCKERWCSCWIPPPKKNCAEAPHPCLRCCHTWAPLANAQTLRGHKMKPTKLQKQKRPQSPGLPGDQRPRDDRFCERKFRTRLGSQRLSKWGNHLFGDQKLKAANMNKKYQTITVMNPSFAANLWTPVSLLPWRLAELQKISNMDRTTNQQFFCDDLFLAAVEKHEIYIYSRPLWPVWPRWPIFIYRKMIQ